MHEISEKIPNFYSVKGYFMCHTAGPIGNGNGDTNFTVEGCIMENYWNTHESCKQDGTKI